VAAQSACRQQQQGIHLVFVPAHREHVFVFDPGVKVYPCCPACCRETAKAVDKGKAKLVVVAPNIEEVGSMAYRHRYPCLEFVRFANLGHVI